MDGEEYTNKTDEGLSRKERRKQRMQPRDACHAMEEHEVHQRVGFECYPTNVGQNHAAT